MTRSTALTLVLSGLLLGCASDPTGPTGQPDGGSWATWVLASGSVLRPSAPGAPSVAETAEVLARQAGLNAAGQETIARWDEAPSLAWNDVLLERLGFYWVLLPDVRDATPVRSARAQALLNVAIYDALVAVWDAKYAYRREAPWRTDSRIRRLGAAEVEPAFPSAHAAAAAAAAAILAYVFPHDDPGSFQALAHEAAESRITAGLAWRSDVDAGWAIGQAVADQVLARARADGSDQVWTGTVPDGPWYWKPTPPRRVQVPLDPLAGSWKTWVLSRGNALRPQPPPAGGSAAFVRDLDELRQLSTTRTTAQADQARYWATETPASRWIVDLQEELRARRTPALHAARAQALVGVATADAMVACWDGKFFYWLLRPITADPSLVTAFSTPPFPSYPSGHSTGSTAAGEVFAYLFPDRADHYRQRAADASESRVLAGVHYRFDILAGEALGRAVGEAVVARARSDGADR